MVVSKMSLKLLIDRKAQKVLFAEGGKDTIDFLFSLLSLPVGTIVKLLRKDTMVGCMGNLYKSVEGFEETYMQSDLAKSKLLEPNGLTISATDHGPRLMLTNGPSKPHKTSYLCKNCRLYISDVVDTVCPRCNVSMRSPVTYVYPSNIAEASTSEEGFVKGLVSYMVMDDLSVAPMSMVSSISLLNKFNVKEFDSLEEKVVKIGFDEGLKLLKASLQSSAVLTDVFLTSNQSIEEGRKTEEIDYRAD